MKVDIDMTYYLISARREGKLLCCLFNGLFVGHKGMKWEYIPDNGMLRKNKSEKEMKELYYIAHKK